MKKRIISLVLALVMIVATLVSCGQTSIVSRNLNDYLVAPFDEAAKQAFIEKLAKLEITDGEYTNDPAIRETIVKEDIYNLVASAIVTENKKKENGVVDANDIVYYNYYITDEAEVVYDFAFMKASSISSNKDKHNLKLGLVSENDKDFEFTGKIKDAFVNLGADIKDYIYLVKSNKAGDAVTVGDDTTVRAVISYTDKYTKDGAEIVKKATFREIVLGKNSPDEFIKKLTSADTKLLIDKDAEFKKTEGEGTDNFFTLNVDGVDHTYSSVQVEWIIEKGKELTFEYTPDEEFKRTPDSLSASSSTPVDLNGKKLTYHIYPVYYYAVAGNDVSVDAESFIKYALGKDVKVDSFDVFGDENYKIDTDEDGNGDKTAKALVEELVKIYSTASSKTEKFDKNSSDAYIKLLGRIQAEDFIDESLTEEAIPEKDKPLVALFYLSLLQNAGDSSDEAEEKVNRALVWIYANMADDKAVTGEGGLKALREECENPDKNEAEIETAKNNFRAAALSLYEDKKTEYYNDALDAAKTAKIAQIVAATYCGEEEGKPETLGEAVLAEKKAEIEYEREIEYNEYISEEVGKAVYKLIDETVKIADDKYPEDLVKEFYNHLYESYEYKFYKGNSSVKDKDGKTQSNYKAYGNLENFLNSKDGAKNGTEENAKDYVEAITIQAKRHVAPLIKLYVIAQAFGDEANTKAIDFINSDIAAGRYDADYEDDDKLSAAENQKNREEAEKSAKENADKAKENAKKMLVTDAVYEEYKREIGSAYSYYEEQYGEQNLRAALQSNRLFYFFLSTELEKDNNEDASDNVKIKAEKNADGKWEVKFHNDYIGYVLVDGDADADDGHDHTEDDGHNH